MLYGPPLPPVEAGMPEVQYKVDPRAVLGLGLTGKARRMHETVVEHDAAMLPQYPLLAVDGQRGDPGRRDAEGQLDPVPTRPRGTVTDAGGGATNGRTAFYNRF